MIANLLTNRLPMPLGFELDEAPRLSWECDEPGAVFRVEISTEEAFGAPLFDSGFDPRIDSLCYRLPFGPLAPRTRYFWRVSTEKSSGVSWLETSKMEEPWQAQWIAPDFTPSWHPVIYTAFQVRKPVASARAYVCGLGLYEMTLNDYKVGEEYLSPGLCAYDKWIPYQTCDITKDIAQGENRVEISLGNGWYKGRYGLDRGADFHYGEEFACVCEIALAYTDGTAEIIASDPTWKARRSAILDSSIFDGETRDDTLDTTAIYPTKAAQVDIRLLKPRRSPPVRVMQRIRPVEIITTKKGDTVLDMGQNMVGWLECALDAPKGTQVLLQFGEVMQNGEFYRDNLRTARCEYRYTSDGAAQVIRPRFTYFGFRFVKLTGWKAKPSPDDFTGLVLYSCMPQTGFITTGNEKVNKLFENTLWGQRGNFLDVPTDCPQRDERMGWTGDAQVFFGTAAYNMDVSAFFAKYCDDLMQEQAALGGTVPVVVPKHDVWQTGACAWGDAATIIPWNLYIRYGDETLLRQLYPAMKGWVEYIRSRDDGSRLWKGDFHYGDWLSLDGEDPIGNRFGGTERVYLASCFYRHSTMLAMKAAKVLGYAEDEKVYAKLSEEVKEAILREYVTETGRLALTTQTAYVLALYMEIMPEKWRKKTAYALRLKLKESGYHLRTGFIGTPYLCRVLSETGSNDIAYHLLLQEDYPSWLYEVNMGATTVWERWNSILPDGSISDTGMNSLNHYAYGSIVEWMYQNAAGIQPLEAYPGFRRFRLAPQPDARLKSLSAAFHSPMGIIASEWRIDSKKDVHYRFVVPVGAVAEMALPDGREAALASGEHTFCHAALATDPLDIPISEYYAAPETRRAFEARYPKLSRMMLFEMMAGERSLRDFALEGFDITGAEEA